MGGMPSAPWRTGIQASFRGQQFKVEVGGKGGGRRNVTHEFPERDIPFTEDMGRLARRFPITGYIVCGPTLTDYRSARDALIAACEQYGPGQLIHPTLGSMQVNCDTYAVSETRERGGMVTFEMVFVEAGNLAGVADDPQAVVATAAANLGQAASQGVDRATQSSFSDTGGVVTA